MNEYRLSVTQTIHHVVYAYGVDLASAEESALDAMNECALLLEGCDVDVVCEHTAPVDLEDDGGWAVMGGANREPFVYQVVPDPEEMPHEQE